MTRIILEPKNWTNGLLSDYLREVADGLDEETLCCNLVEGGNALKIVEVSNDGRLDC